MKQWSVMLVAVAAAALLAAPVSPARAHKACGVIPNGKPWTMPAFGKEGTAWRVGATGVQCSFAKQWAQKLLKTTWRGEAGTILKGPPGWSCLPSVSMEVGTKGTPGECRKGKKVFFWGPNT